MFLSYNLKFCLKLTLLILIFFSLLNNSWSDEKIGSVTNINGYVISIDKKGNEKELSIYDPVFLDEEIFVSDSSSVTIQYGDNTTIILKEFTSFNVNDFENSEVRKKFKAEVKKGEIVIESGSIAKASDGDMLIDVSKLSLGVRGTRLNIEIDQNENPKVGLSEDSFGNVGEISLTSENQTTNLNEAEQLVEFNQNNEVTKREQTLDEKQEFENVQETLIEISKIDENSLDLQLEQKLQDGKLEDANNDGIVNSRDIEVVKENIKTEKKANLDFIVENSGADNTNFLSDVLDQSDEKNIGETMVKIIEIKDNIIEDVVGNLSDKENTFIISSASQEIVEVKEKIFETIVAKETDKSAEILSKVMAKSDEGTIASVITNITEKNTNEDSTLSLKVMADFSENSPEKLEAYAETNSEQIEILSIDAVQKASVSNEDVDLIAKVVAVVNDKIANIVVEEVSKSSSEEKQSLSAKVFQAIVETEPDKMDIINTEVRDLMIEQTIESAKDQQEGTGIQEQEDFTDIVSDIIVNTDSETAEKIINELNDVNTESNLSLEVISGISEKDENKLNELSENIKDEMNELTIDAVQNAENTSEDSQLIANVVSVINNDLINIMVEEVSKVSTDEKQTLSAKVLQAIVETEPDKMDIINNEIKDVMIEQTVESAKNQSEGTGIQEQEDFTDIVSDIIVNTDSETAEKIINELNDVNTDTNLSLKVISGISQKDAKKLDELAGNNLEQIEELTTDAVQNAENTSEDSDLIAQVVSVVNDNFANKVVEEVNKAAELDETKDSLSAKVLQAIVDEEPAKIEAISKENKDQLIEDAVDAAKKQKEGDIIDETDYTKIITDVMVNTETETASKILEEVDNIETDSNFKLDFIDVLKEEENFDKTLDILSATSVQNNDAITNIINEAIDKIEDDEDVSKITDILKDSEGSLSEKILDAGNKNKENKEKISEVLKEVAEEDPDKVIEIIENNKNTNEILDAIKDKIENEEAITAEDFSNVFDENVSPN